MNKKITTEYYSAIFCMVAERFEYTRTNSFKKFLKGIPGKLAYGNNNYISSTTLLEELK